MFASFRPAGQLPWPSRRRAVLARRAPGGNKILPAADLANGDTPAHQCARVPRSGGSCAVAITWEQIEAGKRRLERLSRGLMKEAVIVDEHDDPCLRVERLAYLQALRDAIAGLEMARVVLANEVHITQSEERYAALGRRRVETAF